MQDVGAQTRLAAPTATGNRYDGLNALRGLAASAVVVVHVWGIHQLEIPGELWFVKTYFPLGVTLFFVLSAFSLFVSTRTRIGTAGWIGDFALRRFFRIAPLFYVMVLFYAGFLPMIGYGQASLASVLLTLSFLFNFVPGEHVSVVWAGWTIGVEMLFYMLLPAALATVSGLRQAGLLLAGAVVVSMLFIHFYQTPAFPALFADFSFFGALGVFAWGIFAFFAHHRLQQHPQARRWGLVMLAAAVALVVPFIAWEGTWLAYPVTRALLWAPAFALLVVSQCLAPIALITNRVWSHLGMLSFSLYLCHPPLVYFLKPVYDDIYAGTANLWLAFGGCIVITFALLYPLSQLAFHLIERPGMRLGERLVSRRAAVRGAIRA